MYFLEITSTLCFHRFKFSFDFLGGCVSKQQGVVGLRKKKNANLLFLSSAAWDSVLG